MRRWLMLLCSLLMVAGLGGLATWSQVSTVGQVRHVHDADRNALQQTLGGLTDQYFQFTFLATKSAADATGWTLQPRDARDAAALRRLVQNSPLTAYGAALVALDGRPLTTYSRPDALPAPSDPGYAPMQQALLHRQPGLSAVMQVRGVPVVAFAVPVVRNGSPAALLLTYADVRSWPLQGYDRKLRLGAAATPYVLDPAGLVAASGNPAAVGKPSPLATAARGRTAGKLTTTFQGRRSVVTFSGAGYGWTALSVQDEAAYTGGLPAGARRDKVTLLVLLTFVVALLVLFHHKRLQALQKLADERLYDPLTGLPQRRLFEIKLAAAVARQRRTGSPLALLYCDLNGFKQVNDLHGHNAGDQLLVAVARRLQETVREDDFVVRFGGDEFAVLLEGTAEAGAQQMIQRLQAAVQTVVTVGRTSVTPAISIGGAILRDPAHVGELLHAADLAMYESKAAGAGATIIELGASPDLTPPCTPDPLDATAGVGHR